MLGNVYTLDLTYCDNITHVNAMGNVHTLFLTHRLIKPNKDAYRL
jgi:hypothetical protein